MKAKAVRGFTLVELLVVIGVITILIAMLLPSLMRARRQSMVIKCANNLRQQAVGLQMYATRDKKGMYPPFDATLFGNLQSVWAASGPVFTSTFPDKNSGLTMYKDVICGGSMQILNCPLDRYFYNPESGFTQFYTPDPAWPLLWHDARQGYDDYMQTYVRFAGAMGLSQSAWADSGNQSKTGPPLRPGRASEAILADPMWCTAPPYPGGFEFEEFHSFAGYDTLTPTIAVQRRQRSENNVAYADGHVETHHGGKYSGGFLTWDSARWVSYSPGARLTY